MRLEFLGVGTTGSAQQLCLNIRGLVINFSSALEIVDLVRHDKLCTMLGQADTN
jgi:hypothetical protein